MNIRVLLFTAGIAAVQVGVLKQMIAVVIPYEDGVDEVALVNPKIIS